MMANMVDNPAPHIINMNVIGILMIYRQHNLLIGLSVEYVYYPIQILFLIYRLYWLYTKSTFIVKGRQMRREFNNIFAPEGKLQILRENIF